MQNRDDSETELAADSETRRMATIGSIEQYNPSSGDWEAYDKRLEMFLDANAVAEVQWVATLLTVIGGTAYNGTAPAFSSISIGGPFIGRSGVSRQQLLHELCLDFLNFNWTRRVKPLLVFVNAVELTRPPWRQEAQCLQRSLR